MQSLLERLTEFLMTTWSGSDTGVMPTQYMLVFMLSVIALCPAVSAV